MPRGKRSLPPPRVCTSSLQTRGTMRFRCVSRPVWGAPGRLVRQPGQKDVNFGNGARPELASASRCHPSHNTLKDGMESDS